MVPITLRDLISQEAKRNPSAWYRKLREREPLSYISNFGDFGGAWIATTYDDAVTILKDPRFTRDRRKIASPENDQASSKRLSHRMPLFAGGRDLLRSDPPDQTRLRG